MLLGITAAVTSSVYDLTTQAPELKQKAVRLFGQVTEWIYSFRVVGPIQSGDKTPEAMAAEKLTDGVLVLLNVAVVRPVFMSSSIQDPCFREKLHNLCFQDPHFYTNR